MKIIPYLFLGIFISAVAFIIFENIYSNVTGAIFSLTVPIGMILGMQIAIYKKLQDK
ncbi:hypothetical protein [Sporosarcina sp. ITBMC105]